MSLSLIVEPWLFLGSVIDAAHFEGNALCVHESLFPPMIKRSEIRIPIAYMHSNPTRMVAQPHQLDLCKIIIHEHAATQTKLLVHCMAGVERSPLTIVWYLMFTGLTMDQAYAFVKRKRPEVEDRRFWLDPLLVGGQDHPVQFEAP